MNVLWIHDCAAERLVFLGTASTVAVGVSGGGMGVMEEEGEAEEEEEEEGWRGRVTCFGLTTWWKALAVDRAGLPREEEEKGRPEDIGGEVTRGEVMRGDAAIGANTPPTSLPPPPSSGELPSTPPPLLTL